MQKLFVKVTLSFCFVFLSLSSSLPICLCLLVCMSGNTWLDWMNFCIDRTILIMRHICIFKMCIWANQHNWIFFLCRITAVTLFASRLDWTIYHPLFRVGSWNNGMRCMSLYILIGPKCRIEIWYFHLAERWALYLLFMFNFLMTLRRHLWVKAK